MPEQVVVGRGGCVSLGAQSTHASAAATSINLPIISAQVTREDGWVRRTHLTLGTAGGIRAARVLTKVRRPPEKHHPQSLVLGHLIAQNQRLAVAKHRAWAPRLRGGRQFLR